MRLSNQTLIPMTMFHSKASHMMNNCLASNLLRLFFKYQAEFFYVMRCP